MKFACFFFFFFDRLTPNYAGLFRWLDHFYSLLLLQYYISPYLINSTGFLLKELVQPYTILDVGQRESKMWYKKHLTFLTHDNDNSYFIQIVLRKWQYKRQRTKVLLFTSGSATGASNVTGSCVTHVHGKCNRTTRDPFFDTISVYPWKVGWPFESWEVRDCGGRFFVGRGLLGLVFNYHLDWLPRFWIILASSVRKTL